MRTLIHDRLVATRKPPVRAAVQVWTLENKRRCRDLTIPDLARSGYRFIGGRLVPTPHRPAVSDQVAVGLHGLADEVRRQMAKRT